MYLLKHICIGVRAVINQLIVTLTLITSACLSSFTPGAEISAQDGLINTELFYCNIIGSNKLFQVGIPNGPGTRNVY
jgi:hypothetical protein